MRGTVWHAFPPVVGPPGNECFRVGVGKSGDMYIGIGTLIIIIILLIILL